MNLFHVLLTRVRSYVTNVLIEQGELDRLQQRQIRDYSPELQNMAVLSKQIAEGLSSKGMSADA